VVAASKNALTKASAEKEELEKKNSGSANEAKKDFEELKKAKVKAESDLKSAKLQVEASDTRLANLKKILVRNRTFATESQQKLDAAVKKEEEALKLLAEEKEAHQAALKEALRSKAIAQTEEHDSVTPPPPYREQDSTDSKMLSQQDTSSKVDVVSESVVDKVPPIPKVPEEGFKFVASKDITSKESNAESDSRSSDENKSSNISNSKSASAEETTPVANEKEPSDEIKQLPSSSTQDAAPQKEAKLEGATENASTMQMPAGATEKSDSSLPKKDLPAITPATSESSSKKEDSLREKLLKKKRALEKKIGSPPAKRPTSTPAAKTSLTDAGSRKPDVSDVDNKPDNAKLEDTSKEEESKPEPVEKEAAKTNESAESGSNDTKADEKPQTAPKSGQNTVFGMSANAAPFQMFGSGAKAPTFGTPTSNSFGLAGAAVGTFAKQPSQPAESAPSFGAPVNQASSSSSSTGGTFLNLKPPGSGFGSSAPLVFGSSSNITLPTPSVDKGQQAFSSFQGTPFGSNPFAPGPASASPFGFGGTKKRPLETEQDSSSQKLAKIEEVTALTDTKAEESKAEESKAEESIPVQAKPESES
jgi:hypothetical protein